MTSFVVVCIVVVAGFLCFLSQFKIFAASSDSHWQRTNGICVLGAHVRRCTPAHLRPCAVAPPSFLLVIWVAWRGLRFYPCCSLKHFHSQFYYTRAARCSCCCCHCLCQCCCCCCCFCWCCCGVFLLGPCIFMPHINKSVSCACLRLLKPRLACRKGTAHGRGRELKAQCLNTGSGWSGGRCLQVLSTCA